MPSKPFTTRINGERFTYDWDEEKEGPRTKKGVLSKYEASRPKNNEPEGVEDAGLFGGIKSLWNKANESWLPDKLPEPFESERTEDTPEHPLGRLGNWTYDRIIKPMISPMGVATAPLAALRAGRIGLAGMGTIAGGMGMADSLPRAIENPNIENVGDVGLSALGLASVPLGMKAGAFTKRPAIKPVGDLTPDVPPVKLGPVASEIKINPADLIDPVPEGADSRGFFTLPEKKVPIMPSQRGQYRLGIDEPVLDPTGSGLSIPPRMMAPSKNQNMFDDMLPSRTKELVGGVKSGVDVNDTILPAFPDDPPLPKVVQGVKQDSPSPVSVIPQDELMGRIAKNHPELADAAAQVVSSREKQPGMFGKMKESLYDPLAKSGTAVLEGLGDAGKELSTLLKRTRAEGSIEAGVMSNRLRGIIDDLDDNTWKGVVDHIEGKAVSNDPKIVNTAKQISGILDELGIAAETSGMEMRVPSGQVTKFSRMKENYFPHEFEAGHFSKNAESIKNQLLKQGMSVEDVDFILKNAVEKGPRLISPQHMRSLNLEGYRTDKGALYKHIDDMHKRIAEVKNLGAADLGDDASPIMSLIKRTTNPELATKIVQQQLGRTMKDGLANEAVNTINKVEATVKLPMFAISNMSQSGAPLLRANLSSFAKGLKDLIKDPAFSEQSGALQQVLRSSFQEMGGENTVSKVYGMSRSERLNRSISAQTGKHEVGRAFEALKKNPKDKVARSRLNDLLLENVDDVLKQDTLTDKQRQMAGFRMSEITQGIADPMDLPQWWSAHPVMKIPTMLKRFAFQQTKIIRDAIKENPKRNVPLAMALYTAMGEAIGDTKAAVSGTISGEGALDKIEKRGQGIDRIAKNIADGFAFGILTDLLSPESVPGQGLQWLVGPAISDAEGLRKSSLKSLKEGDAEPVSSELIKKLPFGYALDKRRKGSDKNKKRMLPRLGSISAPSLQ